MELRSAATWAYPLRYRPSETPLARHTVPGRAPGSGRRRIPSLRPTTAKTAPHHSLTGSRRFTRTAYAWESGAGREDRVRCSGVRLFAGVLLVRLKYPLGLDALAAATVAALTAGPRTA
ncbi:hypothetical protein GCM10009753_47270 [Streptantibioticus ferralitis]